MYSLVAYFVGAQHENHHFSLFMYTLVFLRRFFQTYNYPDLLFLGVFSQSLFRSGEICNFGKFLGRKAINYPRLLYYIVIDRETIAYNNGRRVRMVVSNAEFITYQ